VAKDTDVAVDQRGGCVFAQAARVTTGLEWAGNNGAGKGEATSKEIELHVDFGWIWT